MYQRRNKDSNAPFFVQLIIFLLFVSVPTFGNDGSYFAGSTGMYFPVSNTSIRMASERIFVEVAQNPELGIPQAHYSCNFTLENTTDQELDVLVGFPIQLGNQESTTGTIFEPDVQFVYHFSVTIDGSPVSYSEGIHGVDRTALDLPQYDIVYVFRVHWNARQTVNIRHEYDCLFQLPQFWGGFFFLNYIVLSGVTWNGPIGNADFSFTVRRPYSFIALPGREVVPFRMIGHDQVYTESFFNWRPTADFAVACDGRTDRDAQAAPATFSFISRSERERLDTEASISRARRIIPLLLNSMGEPALYHAYEMMAEEIPFEIEDEIVRDSGYGSIDAILQAFAVRLVPRLYTDENTEQIMGGAVWYMRRFPIDTIGILLDSVPGWLQAWRRDEYPPAGMALRRLADDMIHNTTYQFHPRWGIGYPTDTTLNRNVFYEAGNSFYSIDLEKALECYSRAMVFTLSGYADTRIRGFLTLEYGQILNNLLISSPATWIDEGLENAPCYFIAYNIACAYSRLNRVENAWSWFQLAVRMGYPRNSYGWMLQDPDTVTLRSRYGNQMRTLLGI